MRRLLILLALVAAHGCGQSEKPADPSKKITWEQYQTMNDLDKADPYVLSHLEEAAQKKLAEQAKKFQR
jgi:hypothetical protein